MSFDSGKRKEGKKRKRDNQKSFSTSNSRIRFGCYDRFSLFTVWRHEDGDKRQRKKFLKKGEEKNLSRFVSPEKNGHDILVGLCV